MPNEDGNADAVMGWLDAFVDSLDFTRPGVDSSWGKDTAMVIIRGPEAGELGGIVGRCADGVTPEGQAWRPLSADYAAKKEEKYGWDEIGRRTGDTLSLQKLYGRTTIEKDQVTLIYGEDTAPTQSYSPSGYISEQDKSITDVEKAAFLHQQGRAFYGINADDAVNVSKLGQEVVDRLISEANGG